MSEYMPETLPDRMSVIKCNKQIYHIYDYICIHVHVYIYICHMYFQMVCQKLCQNICICIYFYSVSGWGSLEESNFEPENRGGTVWYCQCCPSQPVPRSRRSLTIGIWKSVNVQHQLCFIVINKDASGRPATRTEICKKEQFSFNVSS